MGEFEYFIINKELGILADDLYYLVGIAEKYLYQKQDDSLSIGGKGLVEILREYEKIKNKTIVHIK